MIQILHYSTLQQKNQFLANFDLRQTTLVVSDLSSKLFWQEHLLKQHGCIAGPQILRAQDFWKLLVQRSTPEVEFVSTACMNAFLNSKLTGQFAAQWGLPFAKPSTTLRAINELLPVLCHPDSIDIMDHWFNEELTNSNCSWKNWYYLAEALWKDLYETNLLLSDWSAAYLLQRAEFESFWKTNLLIDLGPEIRTMEVELLQQLSRINLVQILVPTANCLNKFRWVAYPYLQLEQICQVKTNLPGIPEKLECQTEFKRFTAPLAEIKFAVGQIRKWILDGHSPSAIVVFAPDIEEYWPALRWHLKMEQLPFAKTETIKIGSLGTTLAWLSRLKKLGGEKLTSQELELSEFHPLNHSSAIYSDHITKWSRRPVASNTAMGIPSSSIGADVFIEWALAQWPIEGAVPSQHLELCKKWLLEAQRLTSRSYREWINYLEEFLNPQEIDLCISRSTGIAIQSIMSGIPAARTLHIFLGCSESQLKSPGGLVNGREVLSLQNHTGHLLEHPDRDFREYQLTMLWGTGTHQIFTFSESDFKGTELVPSIFWLDGREKTHLSIDHLDHWPLGIWESEQLKALSSFDNHFKETSQSRLPKEEWLPNLSPGSLQTFVSCPFRFFAEKGLKLTDPAVVDLDLDPRNQGSIQHQLLELLTEPPFQADSLRLRLPEIVEQTLLSQEEMFFSAETKNLTRIQLLALGARFIDHEEIYRKTFPNFYTIAREAWFKRELWIKNKNIQFRGKIDRIDVSLENQLAIVIDYKSDIASLHNSTSWLEHLEFQLPAYVAAVENGSAEAKKKEMLPAYPVVAAHYFSLKDFLRKGFTLASTPADIVETPSSKSTLADEDKSNLLKDFEEILRTSVERILDGDFRAIPHPKTDCKKCPWRNLCRAPSQNL
jgi:RecB family exonuclease